MNRLRVIFVPDHLQWVTGTMARAICHYNPWIDGVICSGEALALHLRSGRPLPFEPDVVHFLAEWESVRLQKHFLGRTTVINTVHHVEDWEWTTQLFDADAVQVVSKQWEEFLTGKGVAADQMVMLRNGVDTKQFSPANETSRSRARFLSGISQGAFVVGMSAKRTSNSSGRKAPEIFEAAIQQLSAKLDNLCVFIVGPGWDELVGSLRARGIRCIWKRYFHEHASLARFYRCLDTYWITSRIEGGPVPLLEAMACGVPCISTPVGVAPEMIRTGFNGYLASLDDVEGFVERSLELSKLGNHARRSLRWNARDTVVHSVTWRQTAAAAGDLYHKARERFAARRERASANGIFSGTEDRRKTLQHLSALDEALWSRDLRKMRAARASVRAAFSALRRCPGSRTLWESLVEPVMPNTLQRLKHHARAIRSRLIFNPGT